MIGSRLERRMTLHQLRIFKSTVDQSSFTRAAAALSLSQPAVTHQLQALSRSLGHALFQTQPGRAKLALTPVGQALYERASRMLALVQETDDVIGEIVGLQTGSVRVAGDTTVGIYVVPDALSAFHRAHPHIKLRLDVVNRNRVRELLQTGEADLGILGRLWKDDVFCAEPLIQNDLMWFSAPDHPLVKREPLRLKDLVNGPLLMREPGSGTREAAETIFRKHGAGHGDGQQRRAEAGRRRRTGRRDVLHLRSQTGTGGRFTATVARAGLPAAAHVAHRLDARPVVEPCRERLPRPLALAKLARSAAQPAGQRLRRLELLFSLFTLLAERHDVVGLEEHRLQHGFPFGFRTR